MAALQLMAIDQKEETKVEEKKLDEQNEAGVSAVAFKNVSQNLIRIIENPPNTN